MVAENSTWAAPRIHRELNMLGFDIPERMVPSIDAESSEESRAGKADERLFARPSPQWTSLPRPRLTSARSIVREQELRAVYRQERSVPLWSTTTRTFQEWFKEVESDKDNGPIAFPNAQGEPLSRDGVNYLFQECVVRVVAMCPSLADKRISPLLLRHTVGMHMLQAGVDITVIALWL